ncbi:MAG: TRAP transporter large permease subunit [Betaproteobacteria bacterium]|nr:TRAP transporter large permease subunit [Betaproteobacteria bacterium]
MRKELWFGFSLMALLLLGCAWMLLSAQTVTHGHLGLLMLGLVVVAIMLGFPTAFTLMGMGMMFGWFAYDYDMHQILDLMVQRAYAVMSNDVLIAIPLFVFMGYLVERANLIEKLFRSLHLAMARVPGSLAVATIVTCAIFATATGIVGAVVTLMGLLAFPAMLKAGYNVRVSAGAITAGGCLGILIPPSVLLIVYGATAGVSVVQLYAGAFFPGIMLAALYVGYIIVLAKINPALMPPLSAEGRKVALPVFAEQLTGSSGPRALTGLWAGIKGKRNADVPSRVMFQQFGITLLPAAAFFLLMALVFSMVTAPEAVVDTAGVEAMGMAGDGEVEKSQDAGGLQEPGAEEDKQDGGLQEPPAESEDTSANSGAAPTQPAAVAEPRPAAPVVEKPAAKAAPAQAAPAGRVPAPPGFWIALGLGVAVLVAFYATFNFVRLEIFKMLLASFFPLAVLIIAVLGSIVMGLATPSEAAAAGALGGLLLAAAYGRLNYSVVRDSAYLTAKTSAMVCWLFVGSSIFSAAFALLGGQEIIERWVLSLGLTPLQFMILAQAIIFLLGWPLEWTEIIVIFMPIFIPILPKFGIDPLFFGLLVALNLQTAFLSPPVAMAAFYLKGVAPSHVTLNQIFAGMMPFMGIQVVALVLLYLFPGIGLWLPQVLYGR